MNTAVQVKENTGHPPSLIHVIKSGTTADRPLSIVRRLVLPLLIVGTALFFYWGMSFYYYYFDELVMLNDMKQRGWRSFFEAQNEHFAPYFKALFFAYVKVFGNAALQWHSITVISHVVTTMMTALLAFALTRRRDIALLLAVLCGFSPLIWETMLRQGGLGETSSVVIWMFSLWCMFESSFRGSRRLLWIGIVAAWVQSYTFGDALFYPVLLIPVVLWTQPRGMKLKPTLALFAVQLLNVYVFFHFGSFQNNQNYQDPFSIETAHQMARYFAFFFYANIGRFMITSEFPTEIPGSVLGALRQTDVLIAIVLLIGGSAFAFFKDKQQRMPLLLGWVSYALLVGLVSVSRYRFPITQALSSRYIYLIFPSAILILSPTILVLTRYLPSLPLLLLGAVLMRFAMTYDIVVRERSSAEQLFARNYQLILLAKTDPTLEVSDFLATGPLGSGGSVALLEWLEEHALLRIDHSVPQSLLLERNQLLTGMKQRGG